MSRDFLERPRVLVFLPSWLGDTVMATPALRLIHASLPGSVIVALARPGLDELLDGTDLVDDMLVADRRAVLGPAKVAARLMPFRFDAALLLPNSFSAAITVRLAGIPLRVGYDRDGRHALLTHRLEAPRRPPPHADYAPISAVLYYYAAARALLEALRRDPGPPALLEPPRSIGPGGAPVAALPGETTPRGGVDYVIPRLELAVPPPQEEAARTILRAAGLLGADGAGAETPRPYALLNPGGNNPAKRWPVERFAAVAHHLIDRHGLHVAVNGSPAEAELAALIRDVVVLDEPAHGSRVVCLPELGGTIGSLKGLVRHARVMITNDTGPRHMAAAFGIPCVTLFGPTDPRWTSLPAPAPAPAAEGGVLPPVPREAILVADPSLPEHEVADDHPQRCRIDRIEVARVVAAVDALLAATPSPPGVG